MEPIRFMPLYFVAMPYSIITIIETLFVLAPIHTIDGVRSKPQTPRGTKFVGLHENISREVNKVFASQPLNLGRGGSNPLGSPGPPRPPGYFGLPMVNLNMPPLPPNRPYHW
jgi:hypothetical protein